jgi:hypothetical protein
MGLVPIVAFCTAMSAGEMSPAPPFECVWVAPDERYETMLECAEHADWIREDANIVAGATMSLRYQFDYTGQVRWYTFCIDERELRDFYTHFGVTDLGDIPEEA